MSPVTKDGSNRSFCMGYNINFVVLVLGFLVSCRNQPNDHFVAIQGKQQHIRTWGKGLPVVVFLNGGGSDLEDFEPVQKSISKITKTLSYDKTGIGKSELIEVPRTLQNVSRELNEILQKEGIIDVPIIFVGHSMGGYVARYYLHRYPKNLVGLILIDPGSEFLNEEFAKTQTEKERITEDSLLQAQIKLIPKGFQMEVLSYPQHDSLLKTFNINTNIPITLLESNKVVDGDFSEMVLIEIQKKLYRDFQKKAPQTKIISTSKSGHFIQLDEPYLVIDAIKDMIEKVQ